MSSAESRVVNLAEKFEGIEKLWHPYIVAELNGQQVKLARVEGEFIWHSHAAEDEMFFVVSGALRIELRDGELTVGPGELCVIPRGVEHRPVAEEPTCVMLFEPSTTRHTGDVDSARTVTRPTWI